MPRSARSRCSSDQSARPNSAGPWSRSAASRASSAGRPGCRPGLGGSLDQGEVPLLERLHGAQPHLGEQRWPPREAVVHGAAGRADGLGHEFAVLPVDADRTLLRHTPATSTSGLPRVTWPLVWRPLHDACLEDSLDRAELARTGAVARPARWSPYVRFLRTLAGRAAS
ncbi:hypothetical protein ACFV0B_30220 [Streptomyces xanthophaeus]|uniref:hypothetical protein n=1 Tax=Streptomyces xanthophaeus TaxID=67385 RepID=UPI0036ABA048